MDPRPGRQSGYYHQTEADIITSQADRPNRGGHSGPGRQSHWPTWSGTDLRASQSNHADGDRRDGDYRNIYSDGTEIRDHWDYPSAPHRHADTRTPLGGRSSARGFSHDYAEEEDELDGRIYLPSHNQSGGGRQNLSRTQDRFGDHGAQTNQLNDTGDRRRPRFAEEIRYYEPASARPGRHHPVSHLHGEDFGGRGSFQDNERYGGPQRGGDDWAPDQSQEAYDEPDAGPSMTLVESRGTQVESDRQEEEGRFIPYTFRMLHPSDVEFLIKVFKVRTSKVKEWCQQDYIRMDKLKGRKTNIDPLLSTLTSKDREHYAKVLQRMENEKQIEEHAGWGPRRVSTSFERGFEAGRASVHRERRSVGTSPLTRSHVRHASHVQTRRLEFRPDGLYSSC